MGCRHNYWYSQGAFRCKKCGHVTYKSERKKNKIALILIPIVIIGGMIGYLFYQNYITPQAVQNGAEIVINNATNTIQKISSKASQTIENNRIPIAFYENCQSTLRTDEKIISTMCNLPPPDYQKQFAFNMPDSLIQALQNQVPVFVKTKVYQYGANDFTIGLYDQVGEKNYTVTLWQLP